MAYLSIFFIAIVFMFSLGYRQNQPHALINYMIKLYISHGEKQLQILTINHLSFTDDIYLICFPSVGRQTLLNMRSNYATEHIVCYITQTTLILCA